MQNQRMVKAHFSLVYAEALRPIYNAQLRIDVNKFLAILISKIARNLLISIPH